MGSKYVAGATIVLAGALVVTSVSVAQTVVGSTIQFHYDTFGNRTTATQPTSITISDPTLKFVNAPTFYSRTAAASSTTSLTTAITTTVSGGTPPYLFQLTFVSEGSQTPNASRAFASSYGYQPVTTGYQPVTTGSGPGAATTPALTTTCNTHPCLYAEHWLMTVTDADGNSITNPFGITHSYN
jgi:hypothetical protein